MAFLKPDKISTLNGVTVKEFFLTKHNDYHITLPTLNRTGMRGVTIHNTDQIVCQPGTNSSEQYTRATYYGNMSDTRVHFYCDDVCAWQDLPLELSSWHAFDGRGDGNMKTISIECIMSKNYDSRDRKAEDNAARLCAAILDKYGLGIEHLFTHTHWLNVKDGKTGTVDQLNTMWNSYKMCPAYILPHWADFKAKVKSYLKGKPTPQPTPTTFPVGSTAYVKAGAIDIYGNKASAMYAGANNPLTVTAVNGNVRTLYKGSVPVYRMTIDNLSATYQGGNTPQFVPGKSKVKVSKNAVWWGTNTKPPSWVYTQVFYLQEWNVSSGRAVIGTTPRSSSTTTTGALDIKYLYLA